MCMPNKQKMQNYGYFDILYFKDRSDRDRIAIRPQDRDPGKKRIAILGPDRDPKKKTDRDLGVGSRSDRDRIDL